MRVAFDSGKRIFDAIVALCLLCILSPVMVTIAFLVWLKVGHPVFFKQHRPGKNGRIFCLFKFRTMTEACDTSGRLLPETERLTRLGRWMRTNSLDELPQLWNVLRGDMSLVGPRPLLIEYLPLFSDEQARRHDVRPGVTGWAQIKGRNELDWPEKLALDVWYVENRNFWLDIKVLLLTIGIVLKRKGISAPGGVPMPAFRGPAEGFNDRKVSREQSDWASPSVHQSGAP
jgi:sugar transferase EpsL